MTGRTRLRGTFAFGPAAILAATLTLAPRVASAQALPSYLGFLPGKLTLRPTQYQDWNQEQIPPVGRDGNPGERSHITGWLLL